MVIKVTKTNNSEITLGRAIVALKFDMTH